MYDFETKLTKSPKRETFNIKYKEARTNIEREKRRGI